MLRYPLKFFPVYKDIIWGGTKIRSLFHRDTALPRIAESWELSCHPDGESVINNGEYAGKSLRWYIESFSREVLGTNCKDPTKFPLLIKFIDANDDLSVQVHPDDTFAREHEHDNGKTEMWYVVDCLPGASIVYGLNKSISKEEFRKRIEENALTDVLHRVPVQKGDTFMVWAGTIHAICKGCLIAEIQQSSNLTYRIYDYGRPGKDGKPRELHVAKAMEVASLRPADALPAAMTESFDGYTRRILASCAYFKVALLQVSGKALMEASAASFHALTCTKGALLLDRSGKTLALEAGDTVFVPAGMGAYSINGNGDVLLTCL